ISDVALIKNYFRFIKRHYSKLKRPRDEMDRTSESIEAYASIFYIVCRRRGRDISIETDRAVVGQSGGHHRRQKRHGHVL
ncbi:hypothetical protein CDAR_56601, partial [Caerostris darwini]